MTTDEKVAFLGLESAPALRIEVENPGIPRLCVASLLLRDGPVGVAAGATNVTAFPSELNLAATFDPELAVQYGAALGREARGQGTMGIQGPGIGVSVFDNWGRGFENLGEDPALTSVLGSSLVTGIQGTGEFAMAKHLGPYEQETDRRSLNATVSERANEEIYDAPFAAAAKVGVRSIMCAAGSDNGVESCSDKASMTELRHGGFGGFIRTDAGATTNEVLALKSGVDLFRPFDPEPVNAALDNGTLSMAVVNRAVRDVLTVMFRSKDMSPAMQANATRRVRSKESIATSLAVAERSMVLLKDNGLLPLHLGPTDTVAVVGAPADQATYLSGFGSSSVSDITPVTDLTGIYSIANPLNITYTPAIATTDATPLQFGAAHKDPAVPGFQIATATVPMSGAGLVDFSYASVTPVQVNVDGTMLLQNPATTSGHPIAFEKAIELAPGPHHVDVVWPDSAAPPTVSTQTVDGLIQQAALAAASAKTAIVVVGARDGEGVDRASLELPGYQDQLVAAVAAVNPRTIVVVHSGGPVIMPWLGSVAAVLEAWYPGEVGGTALAAVLSGAVNPSGRLPVAFPTSDATAPMIPNEPWPNTPTSSNLVALGDLGVGSRWYAAHGVQPRFPFGFGLSYTTFSVGKLSTASSAQSVQIRVPVANTGLRVGRFVALANVTFPTSANEPPRVLKAFGSVEVAARHSTALTLTIPISSLRVWQDYWRQVTGQFTVFIGGQSATFFIRPSQIVPQRGH